MYDDAIDYNADLPLIQPWQRAAAREVTEILHLICCGQFDDVEQISQRLFLAAEGLTQMYASPNVERAPDIERTIDDDVFERFHRMLRSPSTRPSTAPQLPPLPDTPLSITQEWDITA